MSRTKAKQITAVSAPVFVESQVGENQATRLATLIENFIRINRLSAGTVLGTKPDLANQYGVGPEILQQAARRLEQLGIAQMRRGKLGGLVVCGPKLDAVAHVLATFFEFSNVSFGEFSVVHDPFATAMYGATARNLTLEVADDMRRRLRACLQFDIKPWQGVFLSFDIRQEMVDLIGNPVLSLLHQATMIFFVDMIPFEGIMEPELAEELRFHMQNTADLVDALIATDIDLAVRVSKENRDFGTSHLSVWKTAEERIVPSNILKYELGPAAEKWTGRRTLADKVARQMLRDIRRRGWPDGANLGTEGELLEIYGISRATFRQAVRLLEHYSAARMLRGPKGGLVVTSPDPDRLVEAMVSHLSTRGTTPDHVRPLQIELYMVAVDLLCAQSQLPGLQALTDCMSAIPKLRGVQLRARITEFLQLMATQSNNPVLKVYLAILSEFASPLLIPASVPDKRIQAVLMRNGAAFLQSLAQRDRARARRAMFDYFTVESEWLGCVAK